MPHATQNRHELPATTPDVHSIGVGSLPNLLEQDGHLHMRNTEISCPCSLLSLSLASIMTPRSLNNTRTLPSANPCEVIITREQYPCYHIQCSAPAVAAGGMLLVLFVVGLHELAAVPGLQSAPLSLHKIGKIGPAQPSHGCTAFHRASHRHMLKAVHTPTFHTPCCCKLAKFCQLLAKQHSTY